MNRMKSIRSKSVFRLTIWLLVLTLGVSVPGFGGEIFSTDEDGTGKFDTTEETKTMPGTDGATVATDGDTAGTADGAAKASAQTATKTGGAATNDISGTAPTTAGGTTGTAGTAGAAAGGLGSFFEGLASLFQNILNIFAQIFQGLFGGGTGTAQGTTAGNTANTGTTGTTGTATTTGTTTTAGTTPTGTTAQGSGAPLKVKATGYFPPPPGGYASKAEERMEGGALDCRGRKLRTLQQYNAADPTSYVSCATDPRVIRTGTYFTLDEFPGIKFLACDVGGGIKGNHIDICCQTEKDTFKLPGSVTVRAI